MFKYDFQIDILDGNGLRDLTELGTNPFIGFSDKHPLNEELDNGVYTILSTRKETFPIFSYFEITITDDDENTLTRKFYIARDEVKTINKMQDGVPLYEHTLSTIELTKKFEKFITEFYCFTQSSDPNITFYTLNDALHRIMRITPIGEDPIPEDYSSWRYGDAYSLLPIPENRAFDRISDKITDLGDIEIPQMFLDNGTLREKLNEILKVINGIARLDTYDDDEIKEKQLLTVDLYNELRNILENIPTESENDDIGIEEYNSNFETFLDNNVNEVRDNSSQITYPAKDGVYDRLKASEDNYSVSDSNCGIRTEYPIYRVDKLYIPLIFHNIQYVVNGSTINANDVNADVENAYRVVEEDVYDALPLGEHDVIQATITTGQDFNFPLTQSSTIVYKYRSNYINCSDNHKGVFFTYPHFIIMVGCSAAKHFLENILPNNASSGGAIVYDDAYNAFGAISVTRESNSISVTLQTGTPTGYRPSQVLYRIQYIPIYDTHFATDKNSTDITKVYSTNLENQGSRIMSFQNFSQHLFSSSQRVGVNEREIAIRHEKLTDLLYNGDYFEDTNEIITICEYIYNNHYILGKYTLSKDYNRINEYIGINSEIRQWQVPANVYERRILIKNYLEIDTQAQNNTSYLTELGCKTILDRLFYDYSYSNIYRASNVFYYTPNASLLFEWYNLDDTTPGSGKYKCLLLGCSGNGGGNTILLGFKFFDNMNAMPIVVEDNNISSASKYLIKKVPYCIPNGDYMGFLRDFRFRISNKNADFTSSNNLPICAKANNDSNDLVKVPDMLVLKDPSEVLNVAYQVSCVSNSEYITIGKWFTIDNSIIKNDEVATIVLNVCYSNVRHGKTFNDRINNDYSSIPPRRIYDLFDINSNANDFDYSQTPYFYLQTKSAFNTFINQNPNIKEIVFAELDTGKIHLVIDIRYFNITRNDQNQLVIGQNTIYFNFTKKRSKLIYDY